MWVGDHIISTQRLTRVRVTFWWDVNSVFLSISQSALGPLSLSGTTYLLSELESLQEVRIIDSYLRAYIRTYVHV